MRYEGTSNFSPTNIRNAELALKFVLEGKILWYWKANNFYKEHGIQAEFWCMAFNEELGYGLAFILMKIGYYVVVVMRGLLPYHLRNL